MYRQKAKLILNLDNRITRISLSNKPNYNARSLLKARKVNISEHLAFLMLLFETHPIQRDGNRALISGKTQCSSADWITIIDLQGQFSLITQQASGNFCCILTVALMGNSKITDFLAVNPEANGARFIKSSGFQGHQITITSRQINENGGRGAISISEPARRRPANNFLAIKTMPNEQLIAWRAKIDLPDTRSGLGRAAGRAGIKVRMGNRPIKNSLSFYCNRTKIIEFIEKTNNFHNLTTRIKIILMNHDITNI